MLHKIVDDIPERAGKWKTKVLSFGDRPEEKHIVRFRDVIDGVRCLWGDPALSKHMVYVPKKVFLNSNRTNRVYSEMWTGSWWHVIQVRKHINSQFSLANTTLEPSSCRSNPGPGYCGHRQDTVDPVYWRQISVSHISDFG